MSTDCEAVPFRAVEVAFRRGQLQYDGVKQSGKQYETKIFD